jgi:hypothetical protein
LIQGKAWEALPNEWRVQIDGMPASGWLRLWSACHKSGMSGPELSSWPDEGSLAEQSALTVNVFDLIDEQIGLQQKQDEAMTKRG